MATAGPRQASNAGRHQRVDPPTSSARRTTPRRTYVILGLIVVLLLGLTIAGASALTAQVGDSVDRIPGVFTGLDENARPPATSALTFLLVGTDTRSDTPTTGTDSGDETIGGARSDVLMIAQVSSDRQSASVVSIPRDSWVDIPGRGMNKINAAYAFGGPTLLTNTERTSLDCTSTTSGSLTSPASKLSSIPLGALTSRSPRELAAMQSTSSRE